MRFDKFPMDKQRCVFRVGSYSYDSTKMIFETGTFGYSSKETNGIALDYDISKNFSTFSHFPSFLLEDIQQLAPEDQFLDLGASLGNFSIAGFEMVLTRYVSTYIITYYLPSGTFLVVKTTLDLELSNCF